MKDFDDKEKLLLQRFRVMLEQRTFDEIDIAAFLILIRDHLNDKDVPYIREFGDLIAHRKERKKGIMHKSMENAIEKNYQVSRTGAVVNYQGIKPAAWEEEWQKVAQLCKFTLTEPMLKEITACIYSLAQYTRFVIQLGSTNYEGRAVLAIDDHNNLYLCTAEKKTSVFHIVFAKYGPYKITDQAKRPLIKEPVQTFRENGVLHLKTASGITIF